MTKKYIEDYFYRRGVVITIGHKNIHGYYNVHFIDRFLSADTLNGLFKLCKDYLSSRVIASNGYIGVVNIVHGFDDSVVLRDLSIHKIHHTSKGAYFKHGGRCYLNEFIKF